MKEIGEYLRNRRIELGISLDEVEQLLKIRKKYLIAIEDGNESALPGKTYFLGYLRNYANYLGVDQDYINQYLEKAVDKPVEKMESTPEQVSQNSQTSVPVDTETSIKRRSGRKYISHRRNRITVEKEKKSLNIVPFLKLAMIILLVGGFALVFNQFVYKLKQPSIPKVEKENVTQEISIEQKMVEIAKENIESENFLESEEDIEEIENKLPELPDYKPIELTALAPSWIKISQDDQVLFEGMIENEEKIIVKTNSLISVITSDLDNITVSYDNNILEPQPLENYRFAGYQIIPAGD